MTKFTLPNVNVNLSGWGPNTIEDEYTNIIYTPFDMSDKLGKVADFTSSSSNFTTYHQQRRHRNTTDTSTINTEFQYKHNVQEDSSFQLVDSSKAPRLKLTQIRMRSSGGRGNGGFNRSFGSSNPTNSNLSGAGGYQARMAALAARRAAGTGGASASSITGSQQQNKRWDRLSNARRMYQSNGRRTGTTGSNDNDKSSRKVLGDATINIERNWEVIEEYDLPQLNKLQLARVPKAEDINIYGSLYLYDEAYDRISTRTQKSLHKYDNREFYYVTTSQDPIIAEIANDNEINKNKEEKYVFGTDAILAHLMTCSRTVFPWDIIVNRVGKNKLYFDKRDDETSTFDLITVNETVLDAVFDEDPESINYFLKLNTEATVINQNFSQQVVKTESQIRSETSSQIAGTIKPANPSIVSSGDNSSDEKIYVKKFEPNPFDHDDGSDESIHSATFAYRYRKWNLGNNIQLIARCELHGMTIKKGRNNETVSEQYINTYALNEWDSRVSNKAGANITEWRQKIDGQRGAVLGTELRNNNAKVAKWTAQALLSGSDQMKLGFVSRANRLDPYNHVVLGTSSYKPQEFANQLNLNGNNMWGVIKMFADFFFSKPEGKYLIMKDPLKPVVRIYSIPSDQDDSVDKNKVETDAE